MKASSYNALCCMRHDLRDGLSLIRADESTSEQLGNNKPDLMRRCRLSVYGRRQLEDESRVITADIPH